MVFTRYTYPGPVPRCVLRVWLPDVPGALGTLATSIGACGSEIVGIDILERSGGRAVDEITLEVPDGAALEELVGWVGGLDGFDVEDVRQLVARLPLPGADPLEAAVRLVSMGTTSELLESLAHSVCAVFACDWATIVDLEGARPVVVASAGSSPGPGWLGAFVAGARASVQRTDGTQNGPRDVAWASLDGACVVVVVGRDGPPFRWRERRQLTQLSQLADARWRELSMRSGMLAHPSSSASPARTTRLPASAS